MISIEALAEAGFSNKILERICTAEPPAAAKKTKKVTKKKGGADTETDFRSSALSLERLPPDPTDWDIRCYLETIIQGEILEGQARCAKDFDKIGAMDLAYASIPIHPLTLPLMQVAMGHITLEKCSKQIGKLSAEWKNKLFEHDANNNPTRVNSPKLIEVSHNLVHSLVTRRVAALATEVYQQYPLLKYDPYSNTQTGRLIGDVMTQLAEQMAGAYDYRHDYEESFRHAALYTDCIKFKAKAWHVDRQRLPAPPSTNGAKSAGKKEKQKFEDKIIREGVLFTIPHPTRRSYDISRPLSKTNVDLGPRWFDHWEPVPIGTIRNDKSFFNRDKIIQDAGVYSIFENNPAYFSQNFESLSLPNTEQCKMMRTRSREISASAESLTNSREAQIGLWSQLQDETATILNWHYRQFVPEDIGIGTYPFPVWVRFGVAGYKTIVHAEIVGSQPASVNSYNASDQLLNSPSFGSQAMQWQQQLTNQLEQLRHVQAQGIVRIWALNTHGMKKDQITSVVNGLKNPDFEQLKDIIIEYDSEKFAQRGQDVRAITEKITQIKIETSQKATEIFGDMMNTLALAERLLFFSPQELGQVSQRTTSALEQKAIRDTTLGIRDYHLVGAKSQMQADKRIIHDSYMAFGSDELEVPVAERYEKEVIEKAGFSIVDDGTGNPPDGLFTIKGKKLGLYYNYTYTTRQTDDTPPDAALAQGLAQIYDTLNKDPVISGNTTIEQRFELANSLFDRIAPGLFKLRVPPGTDGKKTTGGQVDQLQAELQNILPAIGQQIKAISDAQKQQDQKIAQTDQSIAALTKATALLAQTVERAAGKNGKGTPRGQVQFDTLPGSGAPPLNGLVRPTPVPMLGATMRSPLAPPA